MSSQLYLQASNQSKQAGAQQTGQVLGANQKSQQQLMVPNGRLPKVEMTYNTPNNWGSNNNLQHMPANGLAKVAKGHYQQGASRTVGPPQISSLAHPANAAQAAAITRTALTGTLSNIKNAAVNNHPRPGSNRGIHSAVQQHSNDAFAAKGVSVLQGSNNPYTGELGNNLPASHFNQKMQNSNFSLRNSQKVKHSSVGY